MSLHQASVQSSLPSTASSPEGNSPMMHIARATSSFLFCALALAASVLSLSLPETPGLAKRSCDPLNPDAVSATTTSPIRVYGQNANLLGYLDSGTSGTSGTQFYLTPNRKQAANITFATCDGNLYVATCNVRSHSLTELYADYHSADFNLQNCASPNLMTVIPGASDDHGVLLSRGKWGEQHHRASGR